MLCSCSRVMQVWHVNVRFARYSKVPFFEDRNESEYSITCFACYQKFCRSPFLLPGSFGWSFSKPSFHFWTAFGAFSFLCNEIAHPTHRQKREIQIPFWECIIWIAVKHVLLCPITTISTFTLDLIICLLKLIFRSWYSRIRSDALGSKWFWSVVNRWNVNIEVYSWLSIILLLGWIIVVCCCWIGWCYIAVVKRCAMKNDDDDDDDDDGCCCLSILNWFWLLLTVLRQEVRSSLVCQGNKLWLQQG